MSEYTSTNPHGVTYSSTTNGNRNGGIWGAAVAGALGGGIIGYNWGRDTKGNRQGEPYNNGCAPIGAAPYGYAPYGGCSENTPVNRFELKQAETLSNKDAEIAQLKSEKYMTDYVNSAILNLRQESKADNIRQDEVTARLIQSSIDQQTSIASLRADLTCSTKAIEREFETMGASVNREFKHARELSDARYVFSPRVKICSDSYTIECANPFTVAADGCSCAL